jgi:hypothetical protein
MAKISTTFITLCLLPALALIADPPASSPSTQPQSSALTDAHRIDLLQKIDADFGTPYVEPGNPLDHQTIEGTVRNPDGSPLPADLELEIALNSIRQEGFGGQNPCVTKVKVEHGYFRANLQFGSVTLVAKSASYAPTFVGPLLTTPGGKIDSIDVALDPGFAATVQITNPNGKPIPGAHLENAWYIEHKPYSVLITRPISANVAGIITIPHCRDGLAEMLVQADGYQPLREPARPYSSGYLCLLSPAKPVIIVLHSARPTTGVATSAATHQPVVGAKVKQFSYYPAGGGGWGGSPLDTIATTANDGRFSLTSLEDGATYGFVVEAPDGARATLRDIKAGQTNIKAELTAFTIRGTITGHLERLLISGKPTISYLVVDSDFDFRMYSGIAAPRGYHDNWHDTWIPLPVEVHDGVGRFKIGGLHRGYISLKIAGATTFETVDDHDLDLDIQVPDHSQHQEAEQIIPEAPVYRQVIATLQVPQGAPSPRGSIRFNPRWDRSASDFWVQNSQRYVTVKGASAQCTFPIPNNSVEIYPGDLIGYTFDRVGVDLGSRSGLVVIGELHKSSKPNILSSLPGANYKTSYVKRPGGLLVVPTLSSAATEEELYEMLPEYVDIALRPAGSIYGTTLSMIGDPFEMVAIPLGVPKGQERHWEFPAILNPVRHTYVIHALPFGHYKVVTRGYWHGSEYRTVVQADDVSIEPAHVAARADVTKSLQP